MGRHRKNDSSFVIGIRMNLPSDSDLISKLPKSNKSNAIKKLLRKVLI